MKRRLKRFLLAHGFKQKGRFFFRGNIRVTFKQLVIRVDLVLQQPRIVRIGRTTHIEDTARLASCYYKRLSFDSEGVPYELGFHSIKAVQNTLHMGMFERLYLWLMGATRFD